jgi:L-asparagine transporter-like permease
VGLPMVAGGALVVLHHLSINQIFGLFGGFTVLSFLGVYALVAVSSLKVELPGNSRKRQFMVGVGCLLAVIAMILAYLSGVPSEQHTMLLTFVLLVLVGVMRVWRRVAPSC